MGAGGGGVRWGRPTSPSPYLRNVHVLHLLNSHLPGKRTTALEVAALWRHQSPIGELFTVGHAEGRGLT